MASSGTPNEGRDRISDKVYDGDLRVVPYTNTQDSLDENTVYADLTYPTGTGMAIYFTVGVFSETDGIVTYDNGTPDDIEWQNTNAIGGANWSADVTGIAMYDSATLTIMHFQDTTSPVTMTPQKRLRLDLSNLIAP